MLPPLRIEPLVEQPLRAAARQHQMRRGHHGRGIGEMHAKDRAEADLVKALQASIGGLHGIGAQPRETLGRNRAHHAWCLKQAFVGHDTRHALAIESDALRAHAKAHLAAHLGKQRLGGVVKLQQRHRAQAHGAGESMRQEAFLEHLHGEGRIHLIAGQVACAHHHRLPEALERVGRLTGLAQEFHEGATSPALATRKAHAQQGPHGATHADLVPHRQDAHAQESAGELTGCGKPARLQFVRRMRWIGPVGDGMPRDLVEHAKPTVQVEQVGAATHGHMLTVVQHLTRARIHETGGAAAKFPARLDHHGAMARLGKAQRRGDARDAAADHHHLLHWRTSAGFMRVARQAIHALRRLDRRARPDTTIRGLAAIWSRMPR